MFRLCVKVQRGIFLSRSLAFGPTSSSSFDQTKVVPADFASEAHEALNQHGTKFILKKTNWRLEKYYRSQKACSDEEEFLQCLSYMRRTLPQSFRLNLAREKTAEQLKRLLKTRFWQKENRPTLSQSDTVNLRAVNASNNIWQADQDRWTILQDRTSFHSFIYEENRLGHISRQEQVSMVPVEILDVRAHHRVLDMCASPGSKTKQVVEMMQRDAEGDLPKGVVVANESDPSRCFRLSNVLKRLASPNVVLLNRDGRDFPDLRLDGSVLRYDRVVVDQPCCGDGTIRKNPNVWLSWGPFKANALNRLQYLIARRALELTSSNDGLCVYSSCSMNPIENEAVLARLLLEAKGSLEVIDRTTELSRLGLNCAPGLSDWLVFDRNMNAYQAFDQVPETEKRRSCIRPDLFPPDQEESLGVKSQLTKAMRFLPHHNNDGGFFVALIKKKGPLPWENHGEESFGKTWTRRRHKPVDVPEFGNRKMSEVYRSRKEFSFFGREEACKDLVKDLNFYGLLTSGKLRAENFFTNRNGSKVSYASSIVKEILQHNISSGTNIYHAGALALNKTSKTGTSCGVIPSRNSFFLLPFFGKERTVELHREDLKKLLLREPLYSVDYRSEFSPEAVENLRQVRALGAVKLSCGDLECWGFLGERKLVLEASSALRYHMRILLDHDIV